MTNELFEFDDTGKIILKYIGKKSVITIPEGVTEIGEDAFSGCRFREVIFPKSLKKIGARAFRDCIQLKKITFPLGGENLKLCTAAFGGCIHLRLVYLPEQVKVIETHAFVLCRRLSRAILEAPEQLGDHIFSGCKMRIKIFCVENKVKKTGSLWNYRYHEMLRQNFPCYTITRPERVQNMISIQQKKARRTNKER